MVTGNLTRPLLLNSADYVGKQKERRRASGLQRNAVLTAELTTTLARPPSPLPLAIGNCPIRKARKKQGVVYWRANKPTMSHLSARLTLRVRRRAISEEYTAT